MSATPDHSALIAEVERLLAMEIATGGELRARFDSSTVRALLDALVDERISAHGEGQEHAIADVNAGRIDDLIQPRLAAERQRERRGQQVFERLRKYFGPLPDPDVSALPSRQR